MPNTQLSRTLPNGKVVNVNIDDDGTVTVIEAPKVIVKMLYNYGERTDAGIIPAGRGMLQVTVDPPTTTAPARVIFTDETKVLLVDGLPRILSLDEDNHQMVLHRKTDDVHTAERRL